MNAFDTQEILNNRSFGRTDLPTEPETHIIQPDQIWTDKDGNSAKVDQDFRWSLNELQRLVGGYIELVPVRNPINGIDYTVVVNEEGLVHQLPWNRPASYIAGQVLVGNAVLTPSWTID